MLTPELAGVPRKSLGERVASLAGERAAIRPRFFSPGALKSFQPLSMLLQFMVLPSRLR